LEVILGKEFTGPCSKITRRKQTGCDVWLGHTVLSLEAKDMSQVLSLHIIFYHMSGGKQVTRLAITNTSYKNWQCHQRENGVPSCF
jgi:hypothetical protein